MLAHWHAVTQVERLMARDHCSRDAALDRIRAQMPLDKKAKLADIVIDNNGTKEDLRKQVCTAADACMI